MTEILYTGMVGHNADQFPQILQLYIPKGSRVADVTFNKGKFWQNGLQDDYDLLRSDLEPLAEEVLKADLQALPYKTESLDALILDPPYAHSSTAPMKESISSMYNNNSITGGSKQIIDLYYNGMLEARRVLKKGGVLVVKCQDEIEAGKQRWNHIRIFQQAEELGYYAKDLLVLVQKGKPPQRHPYQKHFRKNHSFWWVFILKTKPAPPDAPAPVRQVTSGAPTFVDLFCGAGGASEGLAAAGLNCLLAVDMDPVALASHKVNHPRAEHVLMDLTRPAIRWDRLQGKVDLVHGSPPCQNLSAANNNADPEKALPDLRAYEEAVGEIQPRWFTMENVPQVRHHLNGFYEKVRIYNAADFGVPQTRKRVFAGKFPDPNPTHTKNGPVVNLEGVRLGRWVSLGEALQLEGYVDTHRDQGRDGSTQERAAEHPAPTLTVKSKSQWKFVDRCFENVRAGPSVHSADRPSTTITSAASRMSLIPGGGEPGVGECRAIPRNPDEPSHTIVVKPPSLRSPSHTITATESKFGGSDRRRAGRMIGRQLSNEECAALQSFPPDYVFLGNKTQRDRQIGNAVPPKVAEAIGRAIMIEHEAK